VSCVTGYSTRTPKGVRLAAPTPQSPVNSDIRQQKMLESLSPVIIVSREEVQRQDTSSVLKALRAFLKSPTTAKSYLERLEIAFDGYNNHAEELFEIQEVREFVYLLDEEFPFWLFFLDKSGLGLQCISLCFMPPYLSDEARAKIFPERLDDLLTRRWFPAMNQICDWVGMSEKEIEDLSERSVEYLLRRPQ